MAELSAVPPLPMAIGDNRLPNTGLLEILTAVFAEAVLSAKSDAPRSVDLWNTLSNVASAFVNDSDCGANPHGDTLLTELTESQTQVVMARCFSFLEQRTIISDDPTNPLLKIEQVFSKRREPRELAAVFENIRTVQDLFGTVEKGELAPARVYTFIETI